MSEDTSTPSIEMPRYQCHKIVHALKIAQIQLLHGMWYLHFTDKNYAPLHVSEAYDRKHQPQAGGYYVVYEDGYQSFSPAEAFESGYTRIE